MTPLDIIAYLIMSASILMTLVSCFVRVILVAYGETFRKVEQSIQYTDPEESDVHEELCSDDD